MGANKGKKRKKMETTEMKIVIKKKTSALYMMISLSSHRKSTSNMTTE